MQCSVTILLADVIRTASLGISFVYREYPRPVAIVAYAGFRLAGEGGGEVVLDVRRT